MNPDAHAQRGIAVASAFDVVAIEGDEHVAGARDRRGGAVVLAPGFAVQAEHDENPVADELVERAAVILDSFEHRPVVRVELPDDFVRGHLLAHRRESTKVRGQQRDGEQATSERKRGVRILSHDAFDRGGRQIPAQEPEPREVVEVRSRLASGGNAYPPADPRSERKRDLGRMKALERNEGRDDAC